MIRSSHLGRLFFVPLDGATQTHGVNGTDREETLLCIQENKSVATLESTLVPVVGRNPRDSRATTSCVANDVDDSLLSIPRFFTCKTSPRR